MPKWAEWDHETNNVITIKNEDPVSGEVSQSITGARRSATGQREWLPLVTEYPDDYAPRFPRLLGKSEMHLEDGTVYQRFPEADFRVGRVREELKAEVDRLAHGALAQTDWYFVRMHETGKAVPADIAQQRRDIRAQVDDIKARIDEASPADLLDFDTSIKTANALHAFGAPRADSA